MPLPRSIFSQTIYHQQRGSTFTAEKSGRHRPSEASQAATYADTKWPPLSPDRMGRGGAVSAAFPQTPGVSLRTRQARPPWDTFADTTGLYSSKMSRSTSQSKSEESARLKSRYWTCCSEMTWGSEDSSLATEGVQKWSINPCYRYLGDVL